MIKQKYNADWDLLGYFVYINQWTAHEQLNEIGDWGREHNIREFIYDLGMQDYEGSFVVRVPTHELAIEFLLTFG
jgi:hypothetical protein